MRLRTVSCVATLGLVGCAYIPDAEEESSFSYAEIVNQIDCELYFSGETLRLKTEVPDSDNYSYPAFKPDQFGIDIKIEPSKTVQSSTGLGAQFKTSSAKKYFQWALGAVGPASGTGYSMYGNVNATNTYKLLTSSLYLQVSESAKYPDYLISEDPYTNAITSKWKIISYYDKSPIKSIQKMPRQVVHVPDSQLPSPPPPEKQDNGKYTAIVDDSSPVSLKPKDQYYFLNNTDQEASDIFKYDPNRQRNYRMISRQLVNQCQKPPSRAPVDNPLVGGLGLQSYWERSVASADNHINSTTTAVFEKEYKDTIQIGITPGWYIARGDYAPNIGASRLIDNSVTLTFTPSTAAKPADPIAVYVVKQPVVKEVSTARSRIEMSPTIEYKLDNGYNSHALGVTTKNLNSILNGP